MASGNPYFGLPASTLQTLQSAAIACLQAILLNQSYSLNGRTLTRANLADVQQMVGQLQAAIDDANGTSSSRTYVTFCPPGY